MKNSEARINSGDDWKTPDEFYKMLDEKYHFDFDPCPYQSDFDGLSIEWGQRNFINPPYSRKLKEAFVRKAVKESFACYYFQYQQVQLYSMKLLNRMQKVSSLLEAG